MSNVTRRIGWIAFVLALAAPGGGCSKGGSEGSGSAEAPTPSTPAPDQRADVSPEPPPPGGAAVSKAATSASGAGSAPAVVEAGSAVPSGSSTSKGNEPPPPSGDDRPKLVLWHPYAGDERVAIERVARAFGEANPSLHVDVVAIPYAEMIDRITLDVPTDAGPDVFIFSHNLVGKWARLGILEVVAANMDPSVLNDAPVTAVKALIYGQGIHGIPLAYKSLALYYNKSLVQEPPATMDALIEAAKKVTSAAEGRWGLVYDAGRLYFHSPFLFGFGGTLFGESGDVQIKSAGASKALAYAKALVQREGIVPPDISYPMMTTLFREGKAAFAISGPWFRDEIGAEVDFGVAALPSGVGGVPLKPFLSVEAAFVSARSPRKKDAFALASHLAGEEGAKVRALIGKQPVTNRRAIADAEVQRDAALRVFFEVAEQSVPIPSFPAIEAVWAGYDDALRACVLGTATPEEALSRAEQAIARDLSALEL